MHDIFQKRVALRESYPVKAFNRPVYGSVENKTNFRGVIFIKLFSRLKAAVSGQKGIVISLCKILVDIVKRVDKIYNLPIL